MYILMRTWRLCLWLSFQYGGISATVAQRLKKRLQEFGAFFKDTLYVKIYYKHHTVGMFYAKEAFLKMPPKLGGVFNQSKYRRFLYLFCTVLKDIKYKWEYHK